MTNNLGEFNTLLVLLKLVVDRGVLIPQVLGDSKLVIDCMRRKFQVYNIGLQPLGVCPFVKYDLFD